MTTGPVLYVEDSRDDVFFMSRAWQAARMPNSLVHLRDGQEAIDYLIGRGTFADRNRYPLPCLVLLDLKLPTKGGLEVLKWIREQPKLRRLKVVIVSGSNLESDITLAQSYGITDYIVKPTSPTRLTEIVQDRKEHWLGDKMPD